MKNEKWKMKNELASVRGPPPLFITVYRTVLPLLTKVHKTETSKVEKSLLC